MANFGNPVLSPFVSAAPLVGKHGSFKIVPVPEIDSHVLMYQSNASAPQWSTLAEHPNGHSCKELAKRIIDAWDATHKPSVHIDAALAQWQYILDCGGMARSESTLRYIAGGGCL